MSSQVNLHSLDRISDVFTTENVTYFFSFEDTVFSSCRVEFQDACHLLLIFIIIVMSETVNHTIISSHCSEDIISTTDECRLTSFRVNSVDVHHACVFYFITLNIIGKFASINFVCDRVVSHVIEQYIVLETVESFSFEFDYIFTCCIIQFSDTDRHLIVVPTGCVSTIVLEDVSVSSAISNSSGTNTIVTCLVTKAFDHI